ncbi:MAG: TraR/DksA family transcriptional regulator [Pseudomonadales bacterium]
MADACDLGNDRAQQIIDDALAARRQQASRPVVDHLFCESCGVAIPPKRRELLPGVETCVHCQEILEHKGVGRGRPA